MSERSTGERRLFALALAAVAGFVDAAGYLVLNLFTAHMSGNSARLGVYLGHGLFLRAAPSGFAVVVFVASIATGTLLMEVGWRAGWRSPTAAVLAGEGVLLVVFAGVGQALARHGSISPARGGSYYPLAALAVAAMGLQTSTLQRVTGRTVRTTYVSGMLTNLADELVAYFLGPPPDRPPERPSFVAGELGMRAGAPSLRRIRLIAGIWCSYAAGAVLGSYLQGIWHVAALAVPVAGLAAVVAAELRWPIEANPGAAPARAGRGDG